VTLHAWFEQHLAAFDSNRVRNLRRQRDWTQVEMAEMLGVDRSYLSEIENGKKDPSLRVLKTIADGFKLSLSQLLRGL
jgi:transcriptional regulator with XRE-family HTH domain